jgi:transketolase
MYDTSKSRDMMAYLHEKQNWVWKETLNIHARAPETRVASSLSSVDIFVALYYGKILRFDPARPDWEGRDRLIISKGHGAISLYPILADLGYIPMDELQRVGKEGSYLGGIPDCVIPGFETTNGSLGHGLGVACGTALALKRKGRKEKVFVLQGDGELYEGSVWEAIMFAGQHHLDNLVLILDRNRICMLDYCKNVIDLDPLEKKFEAFGWRATAVDGHDVGRLHASLAQLKNGTGNMPSILVAETVKGKGVRKLEEDVLCHIRNVSAADVERLVTERL